MNDDFFPPIPTNDISLALINGLFGIGENITVFTQIYSTVSAMASLLAGIMVLYYICVGTFNTGKSGKVFGEWSEYWFVARLCLAVSALAPVMNGHSVAQYLIYGATRLGISGANGIWKSSLDAMGKDAAPIAGVPGPAAEEFARGYILGQTCAISANMLAQKLGKSSFIETRTIKAEKEYSIYYDGVPSRGIGPAACGGYTLAIASDDKVPGQANLRLPGLVRLIASRRISAINNFTSAVQPIAISLARSAVAGDEQPSITAGAAVNAALRRLETELADSVTTTIRELRQTNGAEARRILDDFGPAAESWITAGSWMLQISNMNAELMRAMATTPTVKMPTYSGFGRDNRIILQRAADQAGTWYDRTLASYGNREAIQRAFHTSSESSIWSILGFSDHFARALVVGDGLNPVAELVSLGHKMIWAFEVAVLATAKMAGTADAAKATDGPIGWGLSSLGVKAMAGYISGALNVLSPLITTILFALLAPGILLAYVLPATPFIYWVHSLTLWMIRFVLAVVMAPFWAASHISPVGDDLLPSRAESGWVMLLEIAARPIIMIIGLYVGIQIMNTIGVYVVQWSYSAMRSSFGSDRPDFALGAIVWTFLLANLMIAVAGLSFGVIAKGTDYLLHMLGQRTSGDGEAAAATADKARDASYLGASRIQNIATSSLPNPGAGRDQKLDTAAKLKRTADAKKQHTDYL